MTAHPKVKLPAKHYVRTINKVWVHKGTPQSEINASIRGYYDQLSASDKQALQYSKSKSISKKRAASSTQGTTGSSKPAAKKQRTSRKLLYCQLCNKSSAKYEVGPTECCGAMLCQGLREDQDSTVSMIDHASCYHFHEEETNCYAHMAEGHKGEWQDCKQCRIYFGIDAREYIERATTLFNGTPMKRKDIAPTVQVKCTGQCGMKHEVWADAPPKEVEAFVCSNCTSKRGDSMCSCNKW